MSVPAHMLFLEGVYVVRADVSVRFRRVNAPTSSEVTRLTHALAHRICRFPERKGLLERDGENSWLAGAGREAT